MIITTSQQVNELGCCPCDLPECEPRIECQSIEMPYCGHLLPTHDDIAENCVRFANKTATTHFYEYLITEERDPPPDSDSTEQIDAVSHYDFSYAIGEDGYECSESYSQVVETFDAYTQPSGFGTLIYERD